MVIFRLVLAHLWGKKAGPVGFVFAIGIAFLTLRSF
jgi:hypothetical protein